MIKNKKIEQLPENDDARNTEDAGYDTGTGLIEPDKEETDKDSEYVSIFDQEPVKIEDVKAEDEPNKEKKTTETGEYVSIFRQPTINVDDIKSESDLRAVEKLSVLKIQEGSPAFNDLGLDFKEKFARLKLLREASKTQVLITSKSYNALDNELLNFLETKFRKEDSDSLGNISKILEEIKNEQKVNMYDCGIMIKPTAPLTILLLGGANTIIRKNNIILKISIDKLTGSSDIINNDNINAAFERDANSFNEKVESVNYVIKWDISAKKIMCNLYRKGNFINTRTIPAWLNK